MADTAASGVAVSGGAGMPTWLLFAALLGALLLFWVIGAYNRLVAMRNGIGEAWSKVQQALDQRGAAVLPLVAALRVPMAAEQGALDSWCQAQGDAEKAAAAMNTRPVDEARALAWVAAESWQAAAASRVLALLDQHTDLRSQDPVAPLTASWREAQARLPFARQNFNDAAAAYNEALAVFPTQIVARGFGLGRAGLI
ncbi:MAG: LemA family protein [Rubrivivax sp.]|nr:LemA family protein [Rubrivivax sp.]